MTKREAWQSLPATLRADLPVAALYVQSGGTYFGLPGVDPWDEARDARKYAGPHPVVAHPPCSRWSRLAPMVEARWGYRRGADGGCFAAALSAVREYGGVLEHPEGSAAWPAHGLNAPPPQGGWVAADWHGGWTCCVYQRRYGHRAQKKTWLYAHGVELPTMQWGMGEPGGRTVEDLPKSERAATSPAFREVLLSIARSAYVVAEAPRLASNA